MGLRSNDNLSKTLANLSIKVSLSLMKNSEDGTFHGGFVRNRGDARGVRVSRATVDELPFPDLTTVQDASLELEGTRQYPNIKSPLKARKTKLACMGIPSSILEAGSPAYARCVRLANSYKKARSKELFEAHGFVSTGVGALLASASLALSASRFLYEIAASSEIQPEGRGALSMPSILKLASSLSDSSRQNELSAWELAARESVIRKRNDNNSVSVPWLTSDNGGAEKRKPGRPRKEHLVLEAKEVEPCQESLKDSKTPQETS